jgi:hypothetical protein
MTDTTSPTTSTASTPRTRGATTRLKDTTVKACLIMMVAALNMLWLISVGIATHGLVSAKSSVNASTGGFPAYATERAAYEGWLTEDDQSNMAATLASLQEPSQKALLNATLAQITEGHEQADADLAQLLKTVPAISANARMTLADVNAYNEFTTRIVNAIAADQTKLRFTS